jgi:xylan 1,4-beta-xylosidase
MKNITSIFLSLLVIIFIIPEKLCGQSYCNPLNISYRFSIDKTAPDKSSLREAADPLIVLYKDNYYLFASKSGGYWYSSDLLNWNFVPITTALPIEVYAPAAAVINDSLYFLTSDNKIYRTADPVSGTWELYSNAFPLSPADPALFVDTDEKVYLSYGCTNTNPAIRVVELNPKNKLKPIGSSVPVISSVTKEHGWERNGDYNTSTSSPWLEGSWMNKYNGKYYLQYAAPGTENKSYADGVYVADSPLGPYTYAPNNPFSSKPEGFADGAGHSGTFEDKYGNWWHISTITISVKHMFERRLGLFPAGFDGDGTLFTNTEFGDYPLRIPNQKVDSINELSCGWMLLSYKKNAEASSSITDTFPTDFAFDENIRTYWSAQTGDSGEWLSVDLNSICNIKAIQINFAENRAKLSGRTSIPAQQYLVECSDDNLTWKTLVDKTTNTEDLTHQFHVMDTAVNARYLKVTNYRVPSGTFAISGFRVFGTSSADKPEKVNSFNMMRTDRDSKNIDLSWNKKPNAIGYNIRFGFQNDKLYRSYMVYSDSSVTIRSLNAGQIYWFAIDAFGEGGITKGDTIEAIITHDTTLNTVRYSSNDKFIIAYPNPANSYITISKPQSKGPVILNIYNALGEKVQSHMLTMSETKLSVAKMEKGIYFFETSSVADYREITKVLIK